MDNKTLRMVQLVELDIAKEIKRICEKYKIKYFMDGGTLIGAVRHNGFIPWDDDMDFMMLRADYNKFIKIAKKELNPEYRLQTWLNTNGYGFSFLKVTKRNTLFEEEISKKSNAYHEIFVDVFPYDKISSDGQKHKKDSNKLFMLRTLVLAKCTYEVWKSSGRIDIKKYIEMIPFRFISIFVNNKTLKTKFDNFAQKYNNTDSEYGTMRAIARCGKKVTPIKWFRETVELPFEDTTFPAPIDYEDLLTYYFGDYMTPPPEDKRENRHGIKKVAFDYHEYE